MEILTIQEFNGPQDAEDARYILDGTDVDGHCITVELARVSIFSC